MLKWMQFCGCCLSALKSPKKMTTCEQLASFERCEIVPNGCVVTVCQISKGAETNTGERSRTPPIPEGTRPLQLQAAGHVFGRANGQKKNKIGDL